MAGIDVYVQRLDVYRKALIVALDALQELAAHQAFEDSAPEFNEHGIGYEACQAIRAALEGKQYV